MKKLWSEWVVDNPMAVEAKRARKRYLGFRSSDAGAQATLALLVMVYVVLCTAVIGVQGALHPMWVLHVQTGIFVFLAPALLHGAIAGEREARSWELLMTAPVTRMQVVVGKLLGGLGVFLIVAVAFLLPLLAAAALYHGGVGSMFRNTPLWLAEPERVPMFLLCLLLGELVSLSFGVLALGLSLLFSARCKRGYVALLMALGLMMLGLLVGPLLFASVAEMFIEAFVGLFNPFVSLYLLDRLSMQDGNVGFAFQALVSVAVNLALTVTFLVWAERTLGFADTEVKFLPSRKKAPHA